MAWGRLAINHRIADTSALRALLILERELKRKVRVTRMV